jgi:hypothetical protein
MQRTLFRFHQSGSHPFQAADSISHETIKWSQSLGGFSLKKNPPITKLGGPYAIRSNAEITRRCTNSLTALPALR